MKDDAEEYDDRELCLCGHTYDNHVEGGRCGELDGCQDFLHKDFRLLNRLDEVMAMVEQVGHLVQDNKPKSSPRKRG